MVDREQAHSESLKPHFRMTFLENILGVLEKADWPVLQEIRNGEFVAVTGPELLVQLTKARAAFRKLL